MSTAPKRRIITLRASELRNLVRGQIVTVNPRKQWRDGGHPYLSGKIESARLIEGVQQRRAWEGRQDAR